MKQRMQQFWAKTRARFRSSEQATRWEIPTDTGSMTVVSIEMEDEAPINVQWKCGDDRCFHPGQIRTCVDYIERFGVRYGTWVELEDADCAGFECKVQDGKFTANSEAIANGWVDWLQLKTALLAAARYVSNQEKRKERVMN